MNPDLQRLQPYPFERLNSLKKGVTPPADRTHISMSIGEPQHAAPGFIAEGITAHLHGLANYPTTRGVLALREAISEWLMRRFELPAGSIDPERHVLPVNGTREALFAFAQCVVNREPRPLVLMPNPFYQIYEGAALLAGAEPWFMNTTAATGYVPNFDSVPVEVWKRCQLLYLCSPGNPTGAVIDMDTLQKAITLADRYDFIIAADECYSEIYPDEANAPAGLLTASARMGRTDFRRCIVFHSLSKRSNVPGMRSGFVAGDAAIIEKFLLYRTYHGCAMAPHVQAASTLAWKDERHVAENRALYRQKFDAVLEILRPVLNVQQPDAGFYLWPETPIPGTDFARTLFERQNITVLPGSFLSRQVHGIDPGHRRVRLALVASLDECVEAARRIREFINTF